MNTSPVREVWTTPSSIASSLMGVGVGLANLRARRMDNKFWLHGCPGHDILTVTTLNPHATILLRHTFRDACCHLLCSAGRTTAPRRLRMAPQPCLPTGMPRFSSIIAFTLSTLVELNTSRGIVRCSRVMTVTRGGGSTASNSSSFTVHFSFFSWTTAVSPLSKAIVCSFAPKRVWVKRT
eukprot:COSAG04_NODE_2610_length_3859_cov_11.192553_3_plen_180_part_00